MADQWRVHCYRINPQRNSKSPYDLEFLVWAPTLIEAAKLIETHLLNRKLPYYVSFVSSDRNTIVFNPPRE
jgi:hypothetical protein